MSTWLVPDWPAPDNILAAVSTRYSPGYSDGAYAQCNLGLNSGDDAAIVERNRQRLQQALQLPAVPFWLQQVHGTTVCTPDMSAAASGDASVSFKAGQVLAILTADCLPVLFCSRNGTVVGAAHAGWRGLAGGVLEACVRAMHVVPAEVMAWLGPCIGPASYEVDAPVHAAFTDITGRGLVPGRPGHWQADLPELARQRLHAMGVRHIYGGDFDTFRDDRFYSYRRDGKCSGRFASLVWRR